MPIKYKGYKGNFNYNVNVHIYRLEKNNTDISTVIC